MKRLARLPDKQARSIRSIERRDFRLFGDRGERQHRPIVLQQHVAHEIVLVQTLHDDDDATGPLVV